MEIRHAEPSDRPAIRDIARRSLQASYSLSPQAITGAIEEWYDEQRLEESLDDEDHILLVAEQDGQVVGFSESTLADSPLVGEGGDDDRKATILWIHVDPAYRGQGTGTALFDETLEILHDQGAGLVQGRVLADNTEGTGFYESQGFESVGRSEVEIDGRSHVERRYVEEPTGMEPLTLDDGTTVYIDRDRAETGSLAAFHVVYEDPDGEERYGYYCSSCEQPANAMDAMGRIECDSCGNSRKPARWDAAYM
jgi:ribosomal protein S18 acetylase RimI-like enzyme